MSQPSASPFVRALVFAAALAVLGGAANLVRVEWGRDHRAAPAAPPPADYDTLAPAAKLEALQHRLNEMKSRNTSDAEARTAKANAGAYLQISLAALCLSLTLLIYQQRRAAKADAVKSDAAGGL